jgi:4-aminobutyrate aminotransferase-like enzyme
MTRTAKTLSLLREFESRNVTFMEFDGSWPVVWEQARGMNVWDAEGRRYLDLTAAFGVAAAGHANPRVVKAGQRQMARLLHAMGDVHPHALKAELARELSRITFGRWPSAKTKTGKTIFCNSGFEAVEAALKTAMLATRRPGVIAFEGAYHGLGYGALNATHRGHFRDAFTRQIGGFAEFASFPSSMAQSKNSLAAVKHLLQTKKFGAIIVEPVQARGGINVPPRGFLKQLRRLCDQHDALLILDEIYTGFGRTGKWFACEHENISPDLICLGKALTGGFPLSACVGRADVMDAAWPASTGEAIHTSTFLGHPVGCAMALAQIGEIRRMKLVQKSVALGEILLNELKNAVGDMEINFEIRGIGLMAGLELRMADGAPASSEAIQIIKQMLHRGFILLPEGEHGNVISLTPPLIISRGQIKKSVRALAATIKSVMEGSP